jgi:hypothetical protein
VSEERGKEKREYYTLGYSDRATQGQMCEGMYTGEVEE